MIPVITFSYLAPKELPKVKIVLEYASTNVDAFNSLYEKYVLVRHKYNNDHCTCAIHEVPYADIVNNDTLSIIYGQYCRQYGYPVVDKVIPNNPFHIKEKIKQIILFGMDDLWKVDDMEIQFWTTGYARPRSSMPEIIYSVLSEYFEITYQQLADSITHDDPKLRVIQIKKRRE